MDTAKTNAVSVWLTPTNLKAIQASWVSPTFITDLLWGFSDIVIPLIHITCKDTHSPGPQPHQGIQNPQDSFHSGPHLVHFNPDNPIVVETDTSDYGSLRSSPRSPLTMATSTQLHSTHAAMQPAEINYKDLQ